jgi:hypothetical protein
VTTVRFGISVIASSILGLLALSACSTVSVNYDYDRSARLDRLETYRWASGPRAEGRDPRVDNPLMVSRIREAVERELAAKGFRKTSGTPDFYVAHHAAIESKIDVHTFPAAYGPGFYGPHYGWGGWGGSYVDVYQYEEGTLILDIFEAKTKKLVWRGTGSRVVDPQAGPEKRDERVADAVRKILADFPPQP